MKLSVLLHAAGMELPPAFTDKEISGISCDSRKTEPGNLFVCIKGYRSDGHMYAESAVQAGAVAVLAQDPIDTAGVPVFYLEDTRKGLSAVSAEFFGRPSDSMTVFGVTGTNGKTTCTYLLCGIVETSGKECGLLGTIAYVYGGQRFESTNTTPESYDLQRMYHEMKSEHGIDVCVMEVSSHSLALSRTDDISFDYSIFTNLTPDHMDFHSDLEDYYQAKKKLFHQTGKMSVINIDDPYGARLAGELVEEGYPVVTCGVTSKDALYRAEVVQLSAAGTQTVLTKGDDTIGTVHINTPGAFSVSNALCVAAAALEAGIEWDAVQAGIEQVPGVAGRFEKVDNSKNMTVIVDYAHTPDALEKVIQTAREFTKEKVITVFGCGGDRDSSKRPLMGEAAGRLSDFCIVTSDNPRTEDPQAIIEDIVPGIDRTGCSYEVEPDRRLAIRKALKRWKEGDTVIVAGKGHEDYQIIGTIKQHFDDRETVQQIIEQEL